MTIEQLLEEMQKLDVRVSVSAQNRLHVDAPRGVVTPELKATLSTRKPEIVAFLSADRTPSQLIATSRGYLVPADLPEYWRELYEERAAIREYDGGQTREHAEADALAEVLEAMQAAEGRKETQDSEDRRA